MLIRQETFDPFVGKPVFDKTGINYVATGHESDGFSLVYRCHDFIQSESELFKIY